MVAHSNVRTEHFILTGQFFTTSSQLRLRQSRQELLVGTTLRKVDLFRHGLANELVHGRIS